MARATPRGRARAAPVRQSARRAATKTAASDESGSEDGDGGDVSPYFRRKAASAAKSKSQPKPKPATKARATKTKAGGAKPVKAGRRSAAEPTGLTDESDSGSDSDSDSDSGSGSGSGSGSDSASSDLSDDPDAFRPSDEEDESEPESVDSDDLDEPAGRGKGKGRGKRAPVKAMRPVKRARRDVDEDEDEIELEEGQVIAGRIHPAPTKGRVPPGRISQNTLDFLSALYYPANNDREWFKSHEPAFRQAEKEWRDFAQVLQEKMSEVDAQVPVLPARDICHRIYRDIRFSSDKTPYKANFGLTTSRSGRRGIWAGYHMYMGPHNHSLIACGAWQPEKEQLELFRQRVIADPAPLRAAISDPEFVKLFGPPEPQKKGKEKGKNKPRGAWERQNVFGHSDELKVAPKGVDKNHKDIDLLRLRTIAVARYFTDAQVLDPDFMALAQETIRIMAPFVHTLNAYLAPRGHPDAIDAGQAVVVQDSDSD